MRYLALLPAALLLFACATKSYPIAPTLSFDEVALMDCDDLRRETMEAEEVGRMIGETAKTNLRSIAGLMLDYGLGNAMARDEAEAAVNARKSALAAAMVGKGCLRPDDTTP